MAQQVAMIDRLGLNMLALNQALHKSFVALAELAQRVTTLKQTCCELAPWVSSSPTTTFMSSEPKFSLAEKWDVFLIKFNLLFEFRPGHFSSDRSCIALLISLLTGQTCWGDPALRTSFYEGLAPWMK